MISVEIEFTLFLKYQIYKLLSALDGTAYQLFYD